MRLVLLKKLFLLKNSKNLQRFITHNKRTFLAGDLQKDSTAKVLIELNNMQSAHIAYSYIANILSDIFDAEILAYLPQGRVTKWNEFNIRIRKVFGIGEFGAYKSFGVSDFKWICINDTQRKRAHQIFSEIDNNLVDKWAIERISINEVIVGDLIYDSYLRKYNKPTIDSSSIDFKNFLRESIEAFVYWEDYFNSNNVKAINVSHCVYNLAIPLRIAIARDIPSFQTNVTHIYRLNKNNYFAYGDYKYFPKTFSNLPKKIQLEGIEESKKRIKKRFAGQVGVDMAYSSKSAYGQITKTRLIKESSRKKILIATHCFFDSPHSYGNNIFPDFYEWLEFLGKMTEATDYDWYIKTHPDYILGTKEVIDKFITKYPKFVLLPSDSSHHQIIEEGIDLALTVYGTIGFEYAALGIPVINCSINNPHIAYSFNLHPKNMNEYENLLANLNFNNLKIDTQDVYEFYYMKNIYNTENLFFDKYHEVIKNLGGYSAQFSDNIYRLWLDEWSTEKNCKILKGIKKYVCSKEFRINYTHFE